MFYVLSGDESKHSSLLHWVIVIEKKSKKPRIRPIHSQRKQDEFHGFSNDLKFDV